MDAMMKQLAIRLLVTITNVDKSKKVEALMEKAHVAMRFKFKARGTANSEILDCLGLGETDKIVMIGVSPKKVAHRIFDVLRIDLQLSGPGRGIAFTMPLSGLANPVLKMIDEQAQKEIKKQIESEVKKVKNESAYDLVLVAVNQGFSEEVMDAAREAGARGGTVIHARHIADQERAQFWGIAVQEEREIVAILTPKTDKIPIMKAVNCQCGLATEAHGLVFSLPVDDVAGLKEELEEE